MVELARNQGGSMECACGCGTDIPKRLVPTNLTTFLLLTELAEWDRFRFQLDLAGLERSENVEVFLDDGSLCYDRSIEVLHGLALHSHPRDTSKWLKFSRKSRKKLSKLHPGLIQGGKGIEIDDDLRYQLNRLDPGHSYTSLEGDARREAAERLGWNMTETEETAPEPPVYQETEQETREAAERLGWTPPDEADAETAEADLTDRPGTTLADLERKYGTANLDD